jgi:hypothetical protein
MIQHLHYFPCINAFAVMIQQPTLLFDLSLPFKRSSFRNRTIIAGATGSITLSIPIIGGRSIKLPYKEVEIDYNNNWQRDHLRTLCTAYGNSPFFMFYKDELEKIYDEKPKYLFQWNLLCVEWIFKKIKLEISIETDNNQSSTDIRLDQLIEFLPQNYLNISKDLILKYHQVFEDKTGFLPNLSILDLLFNKGPQSKQLLFNIN